jgi:hypothetical protein
MPNMLISSIPQFLAASSTLLNGLVGFWKLDGNVIDSTGLNGATASNITYGSGKNAQGAIFNGTTSFIDTQLTTRLRDFTVAAWFFATATIHYQRIADKSYDTGFWIGRNTSTTTWGGGVLEAGSPYGVFAPAANDVWNQIISIRRNNIHEIWINGELGAFNTVSTAELDSSKFAIGAWSQSHPSRNPAQYFQAGSIDDVGVWSRAIDVSEIKELYSAGTGKTYPF